jgi:upp: uracil phosphoribosyltransferase
MGKFQVISHPLIQHKLSILRREDTSTKDFRELVNEIAMLMGYEVSRDLPLEEVEIQTPITKTVQKQLSGKKLAIVPILRAGIGMVDGFLSLVPAAKVGHIGMYRDEETLEPVEYLVKLPEDIDQRQIFVVDPMLATGGSAILAVDSLKNVALLISSLFAWLQHQKVSKNCKMLTQISISTQHLWMRNLMKTVILFQVLEMQVTVSLVQNKLEKGKFPFFTRLISFK